MLFTHNYCPILQVSRLPET